VTDTKGTLKMETFMVGVPIPSLMGISILASGLTIKNTEKAPTSGLVATNMKGPT